MRNTTPLILTAALAALSSGCMFWEPDALSVRDHRGAPGAYVVEGGWLAGSLPGVGPFDADAYQLEPGGFEEITLHVGARGGEDFGWAMTEIDLDLESILAGRSYTTRATGCAGPSHGRWDWDRTAAGATVTVIPGEAPDEKIVHFDCDFGGGAHTEGGFIVRPQ